MIREGGRPRDSKTEYFVREYSPGDPLRPSCMDCDRPYEEFGLDTVLSDDQWAMIHPDGDGVLCASCIVQRASRLTSAIYARLVFEF